jgi:pyruvate kinase
MQKLTKIVATVGPVSDSEEMIEKLINAGVNIFRFNFKHNVVEWHSERIERINKVARRMGVTVGTLIDLQGPEIRILMPKDQIEIEKDELLIFGEAAFSSKEKGLSITHPQIITHLEQGQKLLADDGTLIFFVHKSGSQVYLKCHQKGILKNRKSLVIPGANFPFPVLVDRDFDGLKLVQKNEIDFIALSFVRSAEDLKVVRKEMIKNKIKAKLVAKIETKKALEDLDNIIAESDGIMVARGDLGVELPIQEVPYYQKIIIKKSLEQGIPVITATQMLQSMVDNPYPTRAEVSDVANATYDLTDAIMLSGETASGKYPLESVEMMKKTAVFNETKFKFDTRSKYSFQKNCITNVLCESAYNLYLAMSKNSQDLAGFLVFTKGGKTARTLSNYRPSLPIFTLTKDKKVSDSLSINFAVFPYVNDSKDLDQALEFLQQKNLIKKGQSLIVVHEDLLLGVHNTSTVRIVKI